MDDDISLLMPPQNEYQRMLESPPTAEHQSVYNCCNECLILEDPTSTTTMFADNTAWSRVILPSLSTILSHNDAAAKLLMADDTRIVNNSPDDVNADLYLPYNFTQKDCQDLLHVLDQTCI